MTSFFDRLNLRPHERRLVVVVALVVFVLLNMWFVWPYFGEWGKVQNDIKKNRATLAQYNAEIARRGEYERKQQELESTGSEMLTSETEFQRVISSQAAAAGVYVSDMRSGSSANTSAKTNQFFQEQSISIQFSSGGKEIVDFLVGIAAQNAMIRVREMNLRPDPTQTKLGGSIIFVGNYSKPQTNAAAGPGGPVRPATRVASAPPAKKP
ncbi:MAG TPA: hypothetical protein VK633_10495 [Verrucomicrobiae bacterium]|nr:hypothetical protein [Verrucomicrobiae bacterium]